MLVIHKIFECETVLKKPYGIYGNRLKSLKNVREKICILNTILRLYKNRSFAQPLISTGANILVKKSFKSSWYRNTSVQ